MFRAGRSLPIASRSQLTGELRRGPLEAVGNFQKLQGPLPAVTPLLTPRTYHGRLGSRSSSSRAGDSGVPSSPGTPGTEDQVTAIRVQRVPGDYPFQHIETLSRSMPGKAPFNPVKRSLVETYPARHCARHVGSHSTPVIELELQPRSPDCLPRTCPAAPHPHQSSSVGGYEQWNKEGTKVVLAPSLV